MSPGLQDRLHDVQRTVRTRPLFTMRLDTKLLIIGATPTTTRRVGIVSEGTFEGERLSGRVLDGGSDWQSVRSDGSTLLDVRLNLETDDGALICMAYKGVRHGHARSLNDSRVARPSSQQAITSGSVPCSRPPLKNVAGSMVSLQLESVTGSPRAQSTAFSSCYD
jgi:hypothetical protein